MKHHIICLFLLLIFIVISLRANELSVFNDLIDTKWTGHYQNSDDSLLTHMISWEFDLNKEIIKETKIVSEVNFHSQTYYYYDYEINQISYLSLMNKKMISKGTLILKNGTIELIGKTYFPNGIQENRKTYKITDNGEIEDHFYRKSKSKWVDGHFIKYSKNE